MYDAGFNSSGRFYEKSTNMLGMTPTAYRCRGFLKRSLEPLSRKLNLLAFAERFGS